MINYKKRTPADNQNIPRDQTKKDNYQLKMSDISKIEQEEDKNANNESQKPHNGSNMLPEQILTIGMDQRYADSRFLDPLSGSVPRMRTNQMTQPHISYPNIPHQSNPNYVINIQQTVDKDSIIVETNYSQKKFMFYDRNKNFLGGFSAHDFIRYITSHVSSNFLSGVDSDSAKPVIEKYICKVSVIEKPSKRYVISMLNYFESPFMGNIETLIKFYTFIREFEDNNLQRELDSLNTQESVKTKDIFNNMMYTLLNHILRIIAALTNKLVANDANTSKIRDSLLNYSVGIVYRLSKFVRNEIDVKVDELTVLNHDLLRIEGIRTGLSSKLDSIQRSVDKQNAEIDVVLRNILMYRMPTQSSSPNKKSEEPLSGQNIGVVKDTGISTDQPVAEKIKINLLSDKSNIFNENSESVLSASHKKSAQQSESLRISELLNEVGKLKAISEKRTSDAHKKESNTLFMTKPKRHTDSSLSSGSAKSLSDIMMLHGNVDYGAIDSENLSNDLEEYDPLPQFKHLNIPSNPKQIIVDIE